MNKAESNYHGIKRLKDMNQRRPSVFLSPTALLFHHSSPKESLEEIKHTKDLPPPTSDPETSPTDKSKDDKPATRFDTPGKSSLDTQSNDL
ncbi:predicted protein [Sclerotinia sclerotiorum 1980 UF-70]|uniref:Uncharacterized protein n=1 Tax=Sclerotinia sclerotiorum (strain ATCC 18683 / 1980 / Ss-1) TaxID=665079 RepID=A7EXM4_SCLS1|nr:predicted protein [Sclerotinia sclerotiorum 1980 UF-70]EDN94216.1 predicted protein [Sclerotinia sclerotiorum 1980 UF-70]